MHTVPSWGGRRQQSATIAEAKAICANQAARAKVSLDAFMTASLEELCSNGISASDKAQLRAAIENMATSVSAIMPTRARAATVRAASIVNFAACSNFAQSYAFWAVLEVMLGKGEDSSVVSSPVVLDILASSLAMDVSQSVIEQGTKAQHTAMGAISDLKAFVTAAAAAFPAAYANPSEELRRQALMKDPVAVYSVRPATLLKTEIAKKPECQSEQDYAATCF
eukprot:5085467-Amphidinium_carterae.1